MGITYRAPTIPSYWEKVGVEGLVGLSFRLLVKIGVSAAFW